MKYRLLPHAEADIEEIGDHISRQSPKAALRLIEAFAQRWELLALHPFSGIAREDIAADVRSIVVGEYLTFYRVGAEAIEILRVLHGRRDIDRDEIEG
ncbi:MAG TPA: type II toxin-antitoxin system RelE/ParE family toxin [Mesorhizobium sp.]